MNNNIDETDEEFYSSYQVDITPEDEDDIPVISTAKKDELLDKYIKTEFREKQVYIDDLHLTRVLIKEVLARKAFVEDPKNEGKKPAGPSNVLGEWFVKVTHRMLTRGNFRGYSDNYKDEFKSNAYLFFARYWWKFDATRVIGNYTTKDGVKTLKPEEEFKGGFSYFTTLAWTATMGALKVLKEADNSRHTLADSKFRNSGDDINLEYYTGRNFNGGY